MQYLTKKMIFLNVVHLMNGHAATLNYEVLSTAELI